MEDKKNEVVLREETAVNTFITAAIEKNMPVETMEKLFNLRKEVKAEFAREAFMKAMASFQKDCPVIEKKNGVKNRSGNEIYKFANLGDIVSQVKEVLAKNELSYDFTTEDLKDFLNVTCTVTHALGHSKSSSFKVPIGTEEYMTDVQKYGARLTFAKRYAFCNALGILTGDEDTDAKEEDKKPVAPVNVKAQIVSQLKELGEDVSSKEKIAESVQRLTQLPATGSETILKEIVGRLTILISEKNDNN